MRVVVAAAILPLALVPVARAQATKAAAPEKEKKKRPEPPPEEIVEFQTDDQLTFQATYYPGTNGPQTIPVLMLHGWKGARNDFQRLAKYLQEEYGHAAFVPDLRGHGESVHYQNQKGRTPALTPERIKPQDVQRMAVDDVEAFRRELKKLAEGKVDLDRLCVIGAEAGAIMALNWTAYDWSLPPLARKKQGQSVKGLVLLSPEWSFRKLQVNEALRTLGPATGVSVLVAFGKKHGESAKTAQRIVTSFTQARPGDATETDNGKKTLFVDEPDTLLQGAKLLGNEDLMVEEVIAQFIKLRIEAKR